MQSGVDSVDTSVVTNVRGIRKCTYLHLPHAQYLTRCSPRKPVNPPDSALLQAVAQRLAANRAAEQPAAVAAAG